MKKLLIIGIIILSIFIIYLTTIDKKIYYLALGDQISLGMTKEGYYEKSFTNYIKEYLEQTKQLETYIDDYLTQGYRITDLINDINNNKEIEETNKTLKNALIKADLITISIGTNDISSIIDELNKLSNLDYNKLYNNINEIIIDLDKLLKLIREYCKEEIILIGINLKTNNEKLNEIIKYANESFQETANKYNVIYIEQENNITDLYPTKEEYKKLSNMIIDIIKTIY